MYLKISMKCIWIAKFLSEWCINVAVNDIPSQTYPANASVSQRSVTNYIFITFQWSSITRNPTNYFVGEITSITSFTLARTVSIRASSRWRNPQIHSINKNLLKELQIGTWLIWLLIVPQKLLSHWKITAVLSILCII